MNKVLRTRLWNMRTVKVAGADGFLTAYNRPTRLWDASGRTFYLTHNSIGFPQCGQVTVPLSACGSSSSSDVRTPNAFAIFSRLSRRGFAPSLICNDKAPSVIPISGASCFAVIPRAFNISFTRNILYNICRKCTKLYCRYKIITGKIKVYVNNFSKNY